MIRPPAFVRGPILATVLFAACAAPSRYLTTRVVDDPIVLPRRMAEVSMYGDRASYSSTRSGWGTGAHDVIEPAHVPGARTAPVTRGN